MHAPGPLPPSGHRLLPTKVAAKPSDGAHMHAPGPLPPSGHRLIQGKDRAQVRPSPPGEGGGEAVGWGPHSHPGGQFRHPGTFSFKARTVPKSVLPLQGKVAAKPSDGAPHARTRTTSASRSPSHTKQGPCPSPSFPFRGRWRRSRRMGPHMHAPGATSTIRSPSHTEQGPCPSPSFPFRGRWRRSRRMGPPCTHCPPSCYRRPRSRRPQCPMSHRSCHPT